MLRLSRTSRNSSASFHMCLSGSGTVSEVAGAALLLAQSGQGCPSPAALLMALGSSLGTFSVGENCSYLHPLLTEDNEPTFGTAPPLATQQVTLKQRWILWTPVEGGWRQGWCYFSFSVDGVVSVVMWRWVEDRQE